MKLLLFLSASHLHAQIMAHGKIVAQHEFPGSPEGQKDFAEFLRTAKHPTYMLVDLIEEDFRQETVPHLIGRSRAALLQRKFDQFYHGTTFHQATLLQRQKTGRRDDDMLFSALTNPSLITPWLNIMLAQQVLIAGIYSVPQISAPLVKDHPSNHLLLISWEKSSGLRQTYFSKHRLQISRLTPVHAGLTFQKAVVSELARTYQYLKNLSLLPPGQTLDVRLIGHSHDLLELQLELPRSTDMRYDFADLANLAKQHNISYRFADSDATQVFMHKLAAKPPKTNYANAGHTHYFTLWRLRSAFDRIGGAVLAGSLLWGAANVMLNHSRATAAESLKIQAQRTLDEAQQVTQSFPGTHASAADMKTGVSIMRKLDQYAPHPRTLLEPISAVLDRFPQIELDNLDWRTNAAGLDTDHPAAVTGLIPGATITLNANLRGFASDYRAALAYLDRFQRELSATGYQAGIMAKPLDISSGGNIADQHETREEALDFSLRLVWKTPT